MRIAFVSLMASAPWGGSEQLWAATASRALEAGHEVLISLFDWGEIPPEVEPLIAQGARADWRPRNVFVPGIVARSVRRIARRLAHGPFAAVEDFQPERILVNQGSAFEATGDPAAIAFLQRAGRKVILNSRVHADDDVSDGPRKECAAGIFRAVRFPVFAAVRNLVEVERSLCVRLAHARVLHSPVSAEAAGAVEPWPDGPVARLACVARLECRAKGQHVLLETLSSAKWISRPWKLVFFGTGPDGDYLRQLAGFLGLTERVEFAGYERDVRKIWRDNQLLVLPSRYEGTPIALLEAMLHGRPVVASDVGDVARYLIEGRTGFLTPVAEAHYLDEALERAWIRRCEWKTLGRQAHDETRAKLDPQPERTLLEWLVDETTAT